MSIDRPSHAVPVTRPLVFHLRGRRQFYGNAELSQDDLAEIAGVPVRDIRRYEKARRLNPTVERLLRLALALNLRIDDLLALTVKEALLEGMADRRKRVADRRHGLPSA